MTSRAILCPVDFSEASRGALRYGVVLAEQFASELVVMTATHPLLAEAAAMETSEAQVRTSTLEALRRFVADTIEHPPKRGRLAFEAAVGKPDAEILKAARTHKTDFIIISSHGLTGFRKLFFGSTTERVLRETPVPVLIVPGDDRGLSNYADASLRVRRILAPVLLPPNPRQMLVAKTIAEALAAPVLLLHVVEPLRAVLPQTDRYLSKVERERRARAEQELEGIAGQTGAPRVEALIAYGEPSEEIIKVARDRGVGLIVMTLQGSPLTGPRIGSVTYRVLCAAGRPVLALPPAKPRNFPQTPRKAASAARGQKGK